MKNSFKIYKKSFGRMAIGNYYSSFMSNSRSRSLRRKASGSPPRLGSRENSPETSYLRTSKRSYPSISSPDYLLKGLSQTLKGRNDRNDQRKVLFDLNEIQNKLKRGKHRGSEIVTTNVRESRINSTEIISKNSEKVTERRIFRTRESAEPSVDQNNLESKNNEVNLASQEFSNINNKIEGEDNEKPFIGPESVSGRIHSLLEKKFGKSDEFRNLINFSLSSLNQAQKRSAEGLSSNSINMKKDSHFGSFYKILTKVISEESKENHMSKSTPFLKIVDENIPENSPLGPGIQKTPEKIQRNPAVSFNKIEGILSRTKAAKEEVHSIYSSIQMKIIKIIESQKNLLLEKIEAFEKSLRHLKRSFSEQENIGQNTTQNNADESDGGLKNHLDEHRKKCYKEYKDISLNLFGDPKKTQNDDGDSKECLLNNQATKFVWQLIQRLPLITSSGGLESPAQVLCSSFESNLKGFEDNFTTELANSPKKKKDSKLEQKNSLEVITPKKEFRRRDAITPQHFINQSSLNIWNNNALHKVRFNNNVVRVRPPVSLVSPDSVNTRFGGISERNLTELENGIDIVRRVGVEDHQSAQYKE